MKLIIFVIFVSPSIIGLFSRMLPNIDSFTILFTNGYPFNHSSSVLSIPGWNDAYTKIKCNGCNGSGSDKSRG